MTEFLRLAMACLLGTALFAGVAVADSVAADVVPANVAPGVSYERIGHWDVDRLNKILTVDTPAFAGIPVHYTPARTGVTLYRVTYPSVIPERGNRPTIASGLVAVPDAADTAPGGAGMPLVSYQHGTVYGKQEVPSFPDQSPETELMIAQFAGQGYALVGADYFGLGLSTEPEGYMVTASHQQATYDMLVAAKAVLGQLEVTPSDLFLAGWSQGGFVTLALLERLETLGIPVRAAATASAPLDMFGALNGFLNFPRKIDASWIGTLFILSSFSFENYYGMPGLAHAVLRDEAYDVARRLYERQPLTAAEVPTDLHALVRPEYFNPEFFTASAFGRLCLQTEVFRTVTKTPVRTYYGGVDEVITPGFGQMAMTYQKAMGNDLVEAVPTGETSHRGTFATAVPQWKAWFDAPGP